MGLQSAPVSAMFSFSLYWFVFLVVLVSMTFGLVKHWMDGRARRESERLRMLEEALKRGDLDDVTRDELVEALTGRGARCDEYGRPNTRRTPGAPPAAAYPANPDAIGWLLKLGTFVGWMALCLGVTFFILTSTSNELQYLGLPGAILSCAGFAMVTFPFVLRELQASPRRRAGEQRP
ncbi:MAG: hypothetical protein VX951_15260 [Planctomycetota bacterium]|nr:hypothetical protein [Planctomycetota bacterium]